jgi:hypothetical protein
MPKHPTITPARLGFADGGKSVPCRIAQLVFATAVVVGAIEPVTTTAD